LGGGGCGIVGKLARDAYSQLAAAFLKSPDIQSAMVGRRKVITFVGDQGPAVSSVMAEP